MTYYGKKRREIGLSQIEVANYLGIDYKRYALIERGKVKMPTNLIDKFNELINRSKGERDINRLNREQVVNEWWDKMSVKHAYGRYELNNKMEEFNIYSLKELAKLLGYNNQSQLCNYLNGKTKVTYDMKNVIYSFFENELNIQEPKEKVEKIRRKKTTKRYDKDISENQLKNLQEWYKNFDFQKWYDERDITINDIADRMSVANNTVRAMLRKENLRDVTLKRLYEFVNNYDKTKQTIEMTLTPIPEEDVPQEIKDSTNEIIEDMKRKEGYDNMADRLTNIYEEKIATLNLNIEHGRRDIAELEEVLTAKKDVLEKMIIKKDIYEELIDTINNDMLGE